MGNNISQKRAEIDEALRAIVSSNDTLKEKARQASLLVIKTKNWEEVMTREQKNLIITIQRAPIATEAMKFVERTTEEVRLDRRLQLLKASQKLPKVV